MKMIFEKNNYLDMDEDFIAQIQREDDQIHLQSAYEDGLWIQKSKLFRLLMQKGFKLEMKTTKCCSIISLMKSMD